MLPFLHQILGGNGGQDVDKTCLASAVCHMVKEMLLHNDAVRRKVMSRKPYQQKVATMA